MYPVETERLTLTPLSPEQLQVSMDDFQQLESALGLKITDFHLSGPVRRAIVIKLAKMSSKSKEFAWYTYWLVIQRQENQAIGLIGYKGEPDNFNQVEIGYGIEPAFRKQGYATEAARGLMEWAFQQHPNVTVIAETDRDNKASQNVLQHLGFRLYRETALSLWWKCIQAEFLDSSKGE
jgi:RimJ/RimL family protein N-acetyltransferase